MKKRTIPVPVMAVLLAAIVPAAAGGGPRHAPVPPGSRPAPLAFRDLAGRQHLLAGRQSRTTVFLFLSTTCPVANAYSTRIVALEKAWRGRGVRFFVVNSNALESAEEVARHARERGFRFPVVKDDGTIAARLGATMTPQAVVLDRNGVLRYRGRIDDSKDPGAVRSHDLREALEAVISGRRVARAETRATGCAIAYGTPPGAGRSAAVTYTRHVAPILNRNCVACHRKGEVAPFGLENYRQAAAHAAQIKAVTAARLMPPWRAESHGEFLNERRLTESEISTLARWVDAGAPEGDARDLPPPPRFRPGWQLGEPDQVLQLPEAYTLGPDGRDVYQCFVIPTGYERDRYVAAMEFRPGNRAVVHHVIAYLDTSGAARRLDAADPAPGYRNPTPGSGPGFLSAGFLGGWAPGNEPQLLPSGVGARVPKGADIVLEVHYHRNGKTETDRTQAGLYFCKGPVNKRVRVLPVVNPFFRIPAGARDHAVEATFPVWMDVTVLGVTPHMHLLGRSMRVWAELPDKSTRPLVNVPAWDFNWQLTYTYREPLRLPKGSRVRLVARYDNSESNPHQPSRPPRDVGWGESTTDEMCLCFVGFTVDSEDLGLTTNARGEVVDPPGTRAASAGR